MNQATESGASIPSSAATEEAPANASESRDRASAPNAPAPDAARSDASRDAARASLGRVRSRGRAAVELGRDLDPRVLDRASGAVERVVERRAARVGVGATARGERRERLAARGRR